MLMRNSLALPSVAPIPVSDTPTALVLGNAASSEPKQDTNRGEFDEASTLYLKPKVCTHDDVYQRSAGRQKNHHDTNKTKDK